MCFDPKSKSVEAVRLACPQIAESNLSLAVHFVHHVPPADDGVCFDFTEYKGPNIWLWIAGFLISVVFSFLSSIALNLQKRSLMANEASVHPRPSFRQPLWLLGFAILVAGACSRYWYLPCVVAISSRHNFTPPTPQPHPSDHLHGGCQAPFLISSHLVWRRPPC